MFDIQDNLLLEDVRTGLVATLNTPSPLRLVSDLCVTAVLKQAAAVLYINYEGECSNNNAVWSVSISPRY